MVATDLLLRYATNPRSGGWGVDAGWLEGGHAHRLTQDVLALRGQGCTRLHMLVPTPAAALYQPAPAAKFINILAEEPAAVAAWLVPRMRCVSGWTWDWQTCSTA